MASYRGSCLTQILEGRKTMGPTHSLVTRGVLSGRGPVYSVAGNLVSVLARRERTGGAYGLIETIVAPGVGAPMHTHSREDEAFYVIEGELEFKLNGLRATGASGAFLHMPKDQPHGYVNHTTVPARVICVYTPGGCEGFFEEAGEPVSDVAQGLAAPRPADPRRLTLIASRYGMSIIGGLPEA